MHRAIIIGAMGLTARAAKLLDLACSAVKAGKESASLVDSATNAAVGLAQGARAGAVVFAPLIASPVFLPCVAAVALGLAGRKVYKEHKAGQAEERIAEQVQERVEQSLKKLLEDCGSIQAATEDGFSNLELGQIDASIDHDQLKADLQTGLAKLTKLAAMQRSDRLAKAAKHTELVEALSGFEQRFDQIDEKLDKLLELLTHRPHFAIKPPPGEKDAFASLRFTNPKSKLVGRDRELEQLDAFLDHTPERGSDFSFWLVTGPGGMGKSRLAHELCLRRQEQYWDVGFWEPNAADNWIKWQPIAPTLIVFDYLLGRTDEIADAIRHMAGRTLDHPVRFLVLEREAQGAWWEKVGSRDGGAARQAIESYQYQKPLELQGFLDDASARAFFERTLPEDEHDQVDAFIRVFRETDEDGRPIYAKAIIEAAEEFGLEKAATFSKAALVLYILRKEHDRAATTFENAALLNGLKNLLAITTLARGVSLDKFDPWADGELRDLMPEKNAFEKDDFRAISSSSDEHDYPGLEPDLLGEMFVLQQLARLKTGADRRRTVRAAWHAKPNDTSLMSLMAIADFGDSAWIDEVRELKVGNAIDSERELDAVISVLRAPAAMIEADVAYLGARPNDAIADYTSVIELDGAPPDQVAMALNNRGVAYGELGRPEDAIADYTSVIKLDGASPDHRAKALVNRGVACRRLDRPEDAIADYTRAIELDGAPPDHVAIALNNRGLAYGQLGRSDDEIADYTRAIELDGAPPDHVAKALSNRGVVYGKLDRTEDAIADFASVIELDGVPPDQVAIALNNRGVVYGKLDRTEDAIASYTGAIELDGAPPDHVATALVNRGFVYGQLDRPEDAIADYTRAIELDGAPPDQVAMALYNRGVVYGQLDRADDEIADYTRAIELDGAPPDQVAMALYNRGVTLGKLGGIREIVRDFGEALRRPELAEDMKPHAIGLLKAVYGHDGGEADDATKQAAGQALRDAGVDPEGEGTGDRPPGTGA